VFLPFLARVPSHLSAAEMSGLSLYPVSISDCVGSFLLDAACEFSHHPNFAGYPLVSTTPHLRLDNVRDCGDVLYVGPLFKIGGACTTGIMRAFVRENSRCGIKQLCSRTHSSLLYDKRNFAISATSERVNNVGGVCNWYACLSTKTECENRANSYDGKDGWGYTPMKVTKKERLEGYKRWRSYYEGSIHSDLCDLVIRELSKRFSTEII